MAGNAGGSLVQDPRAACSRGGRAGDRDMDRHNMMAGSRFWEQPVQTETGCGSLQDPDKQAMCQQATVAGPGGRQTHGRQVRDRDTDRPNM